jgi:NAD(P)-dependent dehydrogenase (short-subunit alcohol dehydrogenase family)
VKYPYPRARIGRVRALGGWPAPELSEITAGMVADQASRQGVSNAEVERRMAAGNSVRRVIDARDIAYIVAFLASPKSGAINGDAIATGGGVGRAIHY